MICDNVRRKRLSAAERHAAKLAALARFMQLYQRKTRRGGQDPNDRGYDRDVARSLRQMNPLDLDRLLRDGEA